VLEPAAAKAPDATAAVDLRLGARGDASVPAPRRPRPKPCWRRAKRALPDDYNPPSRLAIVHLRLGELTEALAAVDRALPKAYGPRKGYVLSIKANILDKQGQRDAATRGCRGANWRFIGRFLRGRDSRRLKQMP